MSKKQKTSLNVDALIANENIVTSDVSDEVELSYLSYSLKVIRGRAIPDVRDGLKPVHRRILYAAYLGGYLPNKQYVKNAKIVGDTMGDYHPHGDGSIYGALTGMSQEWTYRYQLMDFHGNKGSYDGDGPAAMRYTEGKLQKLALKMLEDIDENSVKFLPNYSQTKQEPQVLPALLPNLLLNGASGIAVGYTTEIPQHQLGEVVDAIIHVIKHEDCTIDDIMKHLPGPDFATGGVLIKDENIKMLYETGKGSLRVRAKYVIETNEESKNTQIVFTELPPGVNKPKLVEKIHDLCLEKKQIPRVVDVRDESNGDNVRITIEIHKTGIPELVISELYDKTPLQSSCSYILRAIVDETPKVLTLKQIMQYYIEHRREVVTNRTKYRLEKAENKLHLQKGLNAVTRDIKKAINIITESESTQEAKEKIMQEFNIDKDQVDEVFGMTLGQLTRLNQNAILDLIKSLSDQVDEYKNLVQNVAEVDKVIISELRQLKKEFNDERRTDIIDLNSEESVVIQSEVSDEPIMVILTNKNGIKHLTQNAFDTMLNKNGFLRERNEVYTKGVLCKMSDKFIIIYANGEYSKVDFSDLVAGTNINYDNKIIAVVPFNENSEEEDKVVFAITKNAIVKKTMMDGFKIKSKKAVKFIELENEDEIVDIKISDNNENNIMTIVTENGLVHRFFAKSFKATSAGGKGISGMNIDKEDKVVGFGITNQLEDEKHKLLIFTKHGETFGLKTTELSEFKPKGRVAQGVKGIDFYKKNPGEIHSVRLVNSNFYTLTSKGQIVNFEIDNLQVQDRSGKPENIEAEIYVTDFSI